MNEIHYEHNQCSIMKIRDHESSVSVKTTHRSEQGANSNQNIDKLEFVVSSMNDDRPDLNQSKESAEALPDVDKPSNSSVEPRITASREFFSEFFTLLRELHKTPARDAAMIDLLRETLIQNAETMRKVAKLNDDTRASLASSTIPKASTSTGTSRKPKFVLRPEYDENDSRWTLKHRELVPGLVELMPHTNVYIDAVKLLRCQRLAKDCKQLARLLSVEIFTESALSVCSFTGSRAVAYDVDGTAVRPGLDENARSALLRFVQEYGEKKGWRTGTQAIQHSVYIKMHAMRTKYE